MPVTVNVADCDTQPLWERGRFRAATMDLTTALGGAVIGASVWEVPAGHVQGPHHFHDGVEEWMYVVSGEPTLRDGAGERALAPGTLVAFPSGPGGAHTFAGPGRVVIFSVGARGWGDAFTSVYVDAHKIGAKPGVQFPLAAALATWDEPPALDIGPAPPGACPQIDLRSPSAGGRDLRGLLHAVTWAPALCELGTGEASGPYRFDWCVERWALVITGRPTLRHPGGERALEPGNVVCLPEGESGARRLYNDADEPSRLLVCSAPAAGPWASVHPDDDLYELHVPGRSGYRFRLSDRLGDYWDGEPAAADRRSGSA